MQHPYYSPAGGQGPPDSTTYGYCTGPAQYSGPQAVAGANAPEVASQFAGEVHCLDKYRHRGSIPNAEEDSVYHVPFRICIGRDH